MATAASGLTPEEYSTRFLVGGKKVSSKTVIRRCEGGLLPSTHLANKFPDQHSPWLIMVPDEVEDVKSDKKEGFSINVKHFSFR